jgi:FK506-binding protein 2
MRSTLLLPLLATLSIAAAAEAEPQLIIDRTLTHSCKRKTQNGDTISAHYKGTLAKDGTKFDASYDRNQPLTFPLGAGRVIKGWDLGLLDMCPGDKRTLTIPPELGYGTRGVGPIPGGATLGEFDYPDDLEGFGTD